MKCYICECVVELHFRGANCEGILINNISIDRQKLKRSLVYVHGPGGHRFLYLEVLSSALGYEAHCGALTVSVFRKLLMADHLVFATIDDNYIGYLTIAVLRMLMLKRTTGLFLRPLQCFRTDHIKYYLKFVVFAIISRLPKIHILTILPFEVRRELGKVSKDYIYDPQIWDLPFLKDKPTSKNSELKSAINGNKQGKRVIVYVGYIKEDKGFPLLADVLLSDSTFSEKYFLVAIGQVSPGCRKYVRQLQEDGHYVIDRYAHDDEIFDLYSVADFVWACYHPAYDQASGIFGRSLQFGRFPIVRSGSIIHQLALMYGLPVVAVDTSRIMEVPDILDAVDVTSFCQDTVQAFIKEAADSSLGKLQGRSTGADGHLGR